MKFLMFFTYTFFKYHYKVLFKITVVIYGLFIL